MRRLLVLLGLCAALPLWAADLDNSRQSARTAAGNESACQELSAADGTRLGLIRQMLDAGKPYAALAHLDAAAINSAQAELLRANALRQTGREAQAVQIYKKLLKGCVAGYAYQGLGLIASRAGNGAEALAHLKAAAAALPVDSSIRNDYGYALMAAGNGEAAVHEFMTAIELAPGNRRAVNNLIVLLTRNGEADKARQFAERYAIPAEELMALQKTAGMPLTQAKPDDSLTGMMATPAADEQAAHQE